MKPPRAALPLVLALASCRPAAPPAAAPPPASAARLAPAPPPAPAPRLADAATLEEAEAFVTMVDGRLAAMTEASGEIAPGQTFTSWSGDGILHVRLDTSAPPSAMHELLWYQDGALRYYKARHLATRVENGAPRPSVGTIQVLLDPAGATLASRHVVDGEAREMHPSQVASLAQRGVSLLPQVRSSSTGTPAHSASSR